MSFSTFPTRWIFLVLAGGILLFAGCSSTKPVARDEGETDVAMSPTPPTEDSTALPTTEPPAEEDAPPPPDAETTPSVWIEAVASADVYYALCGDEVKSMADILRPITQKMDDQQIPYAQNPSDEWRDCSGNFLRLSSYVASACRGNDDNLAAPPGITDYIDGGDNKAPGAEKARDSRTLGKWYHEQGRFIPIYYDGVTDISQPPPDLVDNRHLIKPGAVLWFARKKPFKEAGLNGLWFRGPSGAHINHMGTVVAVNQREDGLVISYQMYHGRNPRKRAAITKHHYWTWPSAFTLSGQKYPPFGYWGQFLVGIGTLLPVETPPPG